MSIIYITSSQQGDFHLTVNLVQGQDKLTVLVDNFKLLDFKI